MSKLLSEGAANCLLQLCHCYAAQKYANFSAILSKIDQSWLAGPRQLLLFTFRLAGSSKNSQQHLLEPQQLADIGQRFLHILTTMKHNGALDKTQEGFTALVKR